MSENLVKTFEEGGRGRKQCPECKKYVGAVTKICACDFNFTGFKRLKEDVEKEPKEVKTFEEGGRGRKHCPSCEKYVGVVTKKCICGYVFVKKSTPLPVSKRVVPEKKQEEKVEEKRNLSYTFGCRTNLSTPAGPCPCKLESTDYEAVDEWIVKVRNVFRKESKSLSPSALVYFVRQFYEMFSEEYMLVKSHIEESLKDEIL